MKTTASICFKEVFTFDWTDFYAKQGLDISSNLITSSVWAVTGNGVGGATAINSPETSIAIEADGASVGDVVTAKNTIQIDDGTYQDCRMLFITIG